MNTPLRLAIDFDGVLHDPTNVAKGYKMGRPIEGAVAALQGLKQQGAIIVIHSVWATDEKKCNTIAEWCQYFHIPYDFVTAQKLDVDIYLDNKALRFEGDWPQSLKQISNIAKMLGK